MKYKAQVVKCHSHYFGDTPLEFETLLQKALDDGVAKGWTLFSVSEAAVGTVGLDHTSTLIWEVPSPKPKTPQEVERERKRTTAG